MAYPKGRSIIRRAQPDTKCVQHKLTFLDNALSLENTCNHMFRLEFIIKNDFDHCSKRCLSHQTPRHVSIFFHLHTLNECPSISFISSMPSISSILIPSKSQLGHRFPIFSHFSRLLKKPRWRRWTTRPTSWTWRDRPRS